MFGCLGDGFDVYLVLEAYVVDFDLVCCFLVGEEDSLIAPYVEVGFEGA